MVTGDDVYYDEFITIVDAAKADVEEQRIRKYQCCHPPNQNSQTRHLKDIAQNYKKVKVQWTKQFVAKPQKIRERYWPSQRSCRCLKSERSFGDQDPGRNSERGRETEDF